MKVFSWNDLNQLEKYIQQTGKKTALTIGGFDGPHKGHNALFEKVFSFQNVNYGIVTFNFTNVFTGFKKDFNGTISTDYLKLKNFETLGFDFCLLIDFSKDFSKIKGIDFLNILRKSSSMQYLVVGSDFSCGYNHDTGVAELSDYSKQFDLELAVCEQVLFDEIRISSSKLRNSIVDGDFSYANQLLIFPFALDVHSYEWIEDSAYKSSSVNRRIIVANRMGIQVCPKSGSFNVKVSCSNKDLSFDSILYVESIFLRLEVPLELVSYDFSTITFI